MQKTILDINLAFNEVCQKRQPLELNKAVSYLILATMLSLTVLLTSGSNKAPLIIYGTLQNVKQQGMISHLFNQSIIFILSRCQWNPIQCGSVLSQLLERGDQYHWMWMLVDPSFHSGDSVWICALHMGQVFSLSNHMETQFSQNICLQASLIGSL